MEHKQNKQFENPTLEIVYITKDAILSGSCTEDGCDTNTCPDNCSDQCIVAGTKITMGDGSIKNVEDICVGDVVMTFDHEKGHFVGNRVHFAYKGDVEKCAFTLCFEDGTELSIVGKHDLFEKESNKYVCISEDDTEKFIGKHFYSVAKKSFIELVNVKREKEKTAYYEIYSAGTFNIVANGMLNVADDVDYMLNIYSFGEDLKADSKELESDIQKYGLLDFDEKYGYSEREFIDWNVRYVNVSVGKGLITLDAVRSISADYLNQK